ncbi:hypothetical protein [Azospirillum sp. TSO35-2]|uniref:hypothetical protein n=1 Tax=Azospirillum sp. TSO35-2 TaxID=716796 RepID=UPI0011B5AC17|nr:hypothetical protein [Azospirillum sp. TSO35-2]
MSLLMLATLLVYAAPGHAGLPSYQHSQRLPAPQEHALAGMHHDAVAAVTGHQHRQALCNDPGRPDDGACCSVTHCAALHGALPVEAAAAFIPAVARADHRFALATPEGIDSDPAPRPPSPIR